MKESEKSIAEVRAGKAIRLQEMKDAWKDIARGKCKKMGSDDFLKEIKRW